MIAETRKTDFLANRYANVIQVIDRLVAGPYWQGKLLLVCLVLIFVQVTPFFNFQYFGEGSSWSTIGQQADQLLVPVRGEPGSHGANKVFRLTVPVLAKLLSLNAIGLYAGQVLCGIALLYGLIRKASAILNDRVATTLFMTAFTACYVSYSAFYDVFGRVDAYGYLLILVSVSVRNPLAIFTCCTLTAWADERGLINTFFTAVYWLYVSDESNGVRFAKSPGLNTRVVAVGLSWIGYFALRWWLSREYGFHTETSGVGLGEFSKARQYIPIALFSTYGAVWLLLVGAVLSIADRRDWRLLGFIGVGAVVNLAVSLLITDINRSLSYTLPFAVLGLIELNRRLDGERMRKLLFVTGVVALLIPIYDFDSHLHYHPHILIRLATLLAGVS